MVFLDYKLGVFRPRQDWFPDDRTKRINGMHENQYVTAAEK